MATIISDEIDFLQYLRETDPQTKVKPAAYFIDDAKARLRTRKTEKRVYLPWAKTNNSFEFRRGEVTLWAGQNGHGKTDITTEVALSLIGQEERICIASFEMKPVTTIQRLVRMYSHNNQFSEAFHGEEGMNALDEIYDEFSQWTDKKLWIYDQTGTASPDTVIGMARYCARELGITHIFIDSLMKCIRGEDDYNGQKAFVDELCALAKDEDIHIHLIHHLKKPPKEADMPDKHDTKGSGSITDQVDNLFMVWRNKPKEEAKKMKGDLSNKQKEPDMYLLCRKQRNYDGSMDGEPSIALWREHESGQFVANDGDAPLYFRNFPHWPTAY